MVAAASDSPAGHALEHLSASLRRHRCGQARGVDTSTHHFAPIVEAGQTTPRHLQNARRAADAWGLSIANGGAHVHRAGAVARTRLRDRGSAAGRPVAGRPPHPGPEAHASAGKRAFAVSDRPSAARRWRPRQAAAAYHHVATTSRSI